MSSIVLSGLTTITTISMLDGWENLTDIYEDIKKVACWFHNSLPDNKFVKIVFYGVGSLAILRLLPVTLRRTSVFGYYYQHLAYIHRSNGRQQIMDMKQEMLKELKEKDHGLPLYQDKLVILELNVGGATNLSYYPEDCYFIGTDIIEEHRELFESNFWMTDERVTMSRFLGTCPEELRTVPDNSVSCVVSFHSLCSARETHRALQEIKRVLMPNGKLYFIEHCSVKERFTMRWLVETNWRPTFFMVSCGIKNIGAHIDNAGFSNVSYTEFDLDSEGLYGPLVALIPHVKGYAIK